MYRVYLDDCINRILVFTLLLLVTGHLVFMMPADIHFIATFIDEPDRWSSKILTEDSRCPDHSVWSLLCVNKFCIAFLPGLVCPPPPPHCAEMQYSIEPQSAD